MTPEAERASEAAEAQALVQETLDDAAAEYRAKTGLVDTYFSEMANALREGTESPPPFTPGATFVENLLTAWGQGGEAWARSGNPFGPGQQAEARPPDGHQGAIVRLAQQAPGISVDNLQRRLQAGASLRDLADGRFGEGLVALVEFRQTRDGKLLSTALVRSSGNSRFDEHVRQSAPEALGRLALPPERLVNVRSDGFRSLWSFEGRILFRTTKKPKELTLRDAVGAAAMVALGLLTQTREMPKPQDPSAPDDERTHAAVPLTGTFDAQSGEVGLVDLTQPRFHCRVKLLKVY